MTKQQFDEIMTWQKQFPSEQKHAQKQADRNEQILDDLVNEWEKYPDGKPKIQFIGFGSHLR
jgi:hypothetical protein